MISNRGASFKIFAYHWQAVYFLSEDNEEMAPRKCLHHHHPLVSRADNCSVSDTIASPTSVIDKLGEWVSILETERAEIAQSLETACAQNEELRDELATVKGQMGEINEVVMRLQAELKLAKG